MKTFLQGVFINLRGRDTLLFYHFRQTALQICCRSYLINRKYGVRYGDNGGCGVGPEASLQSKRNEQQHDYKRSIPIVIIPSNRP